MIIFITGLNSAEIVELMEGSWGYGGWLFGLYLSNNLIDGNLLS